MGVELTKDSIDLGIVTRDAEAALKFYRDTLGFKAIGEMPMPGTGTMHMLLCGKSMIKIVELEKEPKGAPPAPGGIRGATGYRYWTISVSNLAEMIERPDLVADPRCRTPEDRAEHDGELTPIIQGWFDSHTRAEVFAAAQEAGLPGAPVLTVDEVMEDEHFADRGYFVDIVHPDAGALTYTGLPFRLSDATLESPSHAPRLGQHNEEVLRGILGLTTAEVSELTSEGVI